MGIDPVSPASVSTALDPNVQFSKADCPPIIDAEIKERVLHAHGKQIHMAIWARPDLAHCVSVLGRYVHNHSKKQLNAYLRVARYLIKIKDLRIVYGTHVSEPSQAQVDRQRKPSGSALASTPPL
jgi:L-arabinose isomerase